MYMKQICRVAVASALIGSAGAETVTNDQDVSVAYLGVATTPISAALASHVKLPQGTGLMVAFVDADGAAAGALEPNDILLRLDEQILMNHGQLAVLVRMHEAGDSVTVTYLRGGDEFSTELVLGEKRVSQPWARFPGVPPHGPAHLREIYDSLAQGGQRFMHRLPQREDVDRMFRDIQSDVAETVQDHDAHRRLLNEISNAIYRAHNFVPELRREMRRISGSSVTTSLIDGGVKLTLTEEDEKPHLRIIDASGETVFDGCIASDEERAEVPEPYRDRLERLEQLGRMNTEAASVSALIAMRARRPIAARATLKADGWSWISWTSSSTSFSRIYASTTRSKRSGKNGVRLRRRRPRVKTRSPRTQTRRKTSTSTSTPTPSKRRCVTSGSSASPSSKKPSSASKPCISSS